jgi:hypothetical protein
MNGIKPWRFVKKSLGTSWWNSSIFFWVSSRWIS